ncbi:MurR/RpiR family transcriptional regulator [Limibacillus halophilus]|uniref:DNA-binding MurR/RpiR family transcriptional regulator n=1 Tax=Limibacillus halophilus TaxID=1579333 RepID=A0A839STH9_9PROT|nr:MurR/RpiR family transcriptional regulator [Limibacillus halophilus]MBB3066157.1 DNA-binding MurR/RpiR family transcriptional regulator [Limibacillus halophilus]
MATVRDIVRRDGTKLTASERKIASAILADYPFAGLQTIQELAAQTGVSAPSITRFVSKVGFGGYQEFQRQLIGELREGQRSPLDLMASEHSGQDESFLGDYAKRIAEQVAEMASSVPQDQFNSILRLLADPSRSVFLLGGRISDSIATFLSVHLRQIRPNIYHLAGNQERWPDDILRMRKRDVFILFDFRRYQPDLERLAATVASRRNPTIILITDKWMSPIARHSDLVVALPIESGTAWDTVACAIAFVEALIVKVSEVNWPETRKRIEAWDSLRLSPPSGSQE